MRYLKRTNQFLTARTAAEVDRRSELCFHALGYTRRESSADDIVFHRGKKRRSFARPNLRESWGSVRVDLREDLVTIRHRVEVAGRPFRGRDRDVLDAEAKLLREFLDQDERGLDLDELERACVASQRAHAAALAGLGVACVLGSVFVMAWAVIALGR